MPIFYDGGTIKVHRTSEDFYKIGKKYQNIYYVQNYDNLMELYFQIIDKMMHSLEGARDLIYHYLLKIMQYKG